ncbi:MAG: ABC transporter permease [Bacillota bacterium]
MNLRHIRTVFAKDFMDSTREKRTWLAMLIIPLILVPILLVATPSTMERQVKRIEEAPPRLVVTGGEHGRALVDFIGSSGQFVLVESKDPLGALRERQVNLVLQIDKNFDDKVAAGQISGVRLQFDASDQRSTTALNRLQGILNQYMHWIVAQRVQAAGLDPAMLRAFDLFTENVVSQEKVGGSFLAMIMPMMLAIWAAMGGMYAALDGSAGEKERRTLEPLLAMPVSRISLVAGKYLTVVLTSLISATAALVGMYAAFKIKPEAVMGTGAGDTLRFSIPVAHGLLMLAVAFALSGFFAAVQLAVAIYARTYREGQTLLTPVSFLIVIPSMFTQMIFPADAPAYFFHIPLLNSIFIFKEILVGVVNWQHILTTMAWSAVYIVLALRLAAFMFNREENLFRT